MSMTVLLPAATEKKLREKAARAGQTPEDFVAQLVAEALGTTGNSDSGEAAKHCTTGEERAAASRAWAASHKATGVIADDGREL